MKTKELYTQVGDKVVEKYTPQSWALWTSGQKKISKHVWCSTKGIWETPQTYVRRYSGHMRLKCSFLAQIQHQEHPPHSEAWWWQHHAMGMFIIGRDWETGQNLRNDGWR
jgi:hypothetical protein